jgi:type VI secretion system ImpM family protein
MASKDENGPTFFEALGSLFGGGPKILRPALSTYGKLPLYKDFLRHGLAAREAQGFRQWLDRGFSRHWESDEACRNHRIEPHTFSLRFEGLARRVVGGLWGSHDQGELRRFPFTLFVSLPASGAFGDLSALGALEELTGRIAEVRREAATETDAQGFYRRVRETSLTLRLERDTVVRQRLTKELGDVPVRSFAESLYGEAAAERWPALLAYLDRRRAAGRSRDRKGVSPPLACRLPVSPLLSTVRQAQLWAAVLLGTGAKGKDPFNVLLPGTGADPAGGIVVLERDLRPDDVFAFHPSPPAYDFLEDLRTAVPGSAEPAAPSAPGAASLPDGPLASLLEPGALRPAGA